MISTRSYQRFSCVHIFRTGLHCSCVSMSSCTGLHCSCVCPCVPLQASKQPGYVPPLQRPDIAFIPSLLEEFLATLDTVVHVPDTDMADGNGEGQAANGSAAPQLLPGPLAYCERFVTLLVDLLSQLPTRRSVQSFNIDVYSCLVQDAVTDASALACSCEGLA